MNVSCLAGSVPFSGLLLPLLSSTVAIAPRGVSVEPKPAAAAPTASQGPPDSFAAMVEQLAGGQDAPLKPKTRNAAGAKPDSKAALQTEGAQGDAGSLVKTKASGNDKKKLNVEAQPNDEAGGGLPAVPVAVVQPNADKLPFALQWPGLPAATSKNPGDEGPATPDDNVHAESGGLSALAFGTDLSGKAVSGTVERPTQGKLAELQRDDPQEALEATNGAAAQMLAQDRSMLAMSIQPKVAAKEPSGNVGGAKGTSRTQAAPKPKASSEQTLLDSLRAPEEATDDQPKAPLAFEAKLTQRQDKFPVSGSAAAESIGRPEAAAQLAQKQQQQSSAEPFVKPATAGEAQKPAVPHEGESATAFTKAVATEPTLKTSEQPGVPTIAATHSAPKPAEESKTAEPEAAVKPALEPNEPAVPRTAPARDISFRISSANANPVDVQLTDRAGEVRVSVRSGDAALTQSLQDHVSDLASKLDRSGFHTETHIPNRDDSGRGTAMEAKANSQSQDRAFQENSRDRKPSQYEPPRPKRTARSGETRFEISMPTGSTKERP